MTAVPHQAAAALPAAVSELLDRREGGHRVEVRPSGDVTVYLEGGAQDPAEALGANGELAGSPWIIDPRTGRLARRLTLPPWGVDRAQLESRLAGITEGTVDAGSLALSGLVVCPVGPRRLLLGPQGRLSVLLDPATDDGPRPARPAMVMARLFSRSVGPMVGAGLDEERAALVASVLLARSGVDAHEFHCFDPSDPRGPTVAALVRAFPFDGSLRLRQLRRQAPRLQAAAAEDARLVRLLLDERCPIRSLDPSPRAPNGADPRGEHR